MPYDTPVALQYDCGLFEKNLDQALALIDYQGFPARKAEAKARGKLRGIGLASYIEACGIAPSNVAGALGARAGLYESGEVRFHPTGSVTVFTGSHSHGQSHETTFAQLVSDRFGIPIENVEIVHGDTSKVPFGIGTYGSRSLAVGGSAIAKAMDKVVNKAKKIAAHMLEAAETDIVFEQGRFTVAGTDRSLASAMWRYCRHGRTTSHWTSLSRGWTSRPSTTRRTSPIPTAPRSPRSRSIRKPGSCGSRSSWQWTISAG